MTCGARGGFNGTAHCRPEYDALFDRQAAETDIVKRRALIHALQTDAAAQYAVVGLVYPRWVDAWRKEWTGFGPTGLGFFGYSTKLGLSDVAHR